MARRSFGTVRQLPSGRWQARYRDHMSNRMISAPNRFLTKVDAARWLSSIETDMARGQWVQPEAGRITLTDLLSAG
jgi:hypothetical protein